MAGYPSGDMQQHPSVAHSSRRSLVVAAVLALFLASGFTPLRPAAPALAGTAETMEATILSLVNAQRTARGLVPLRYHAKLTTLAGDRVAVLASKGVLSHTAPGCLKCQIGERGIQWYSFGEVLAATSQDWGDAAAKSLVDAWKGSPGHWAILMSNKFNYLGVGVAYRSATGMTYGAIITTESKDQTSPWAQMTSKSVSGTTVTWKWTGADTTLQTHTAGLKSFDVQYRVDGGTWQTIATGTGYRSWSLSGRARGHWYGLRVRARDNCWYTSPWTAEMVVWVR
jgi:uncharacterized protein YkwD